MLCIITLLTVWDLADLHCNAFVLAYIAKMKYLFSNMLLLLLGLLVHKLMSDLVATYRRLAIVEFTLPWSISKITACGIPANLLMHQHLAKLVTL